MYVYLYECGYVNGDAWCEDVKPLCHTKLIYEWNPKVYSPFDRIYSSRMHILTKRKDTLKITRTMKMSDNLMVCLDLTNSVGWGKALYSFRKV